MSASLGRPRGHRAPAESFSFAAPVARGLEAILSHARRPGSDAAGFTPGITGQARPSIRPYLLGREIRSFPNGRLTHATAPQRAREQQRGSQLQLDESGEMALCGGRAFASSA